MASVRVELIEARDLPANNSYAFASPSSNPYVIMKIGNDTCRSKVMEKNLNPAFFETFDFTNVSLFNPLSVNVYDAKKADLLGSGLVYLNMIQPNRPATVWVNFPDVFNGKVHLRITVWQTQQQQQPFVQQPMPPVVQQVPKVFPPNQPHRYSAPYTTAAAPPPSVFLPRNSWTSTIPNQPTMELYPPTAPSAPSAPTLDSYPSLDTTNNYTTNPGYETNSSIQYNSYTMNKQPSPLPMIVPLETVIAPPLPQSLPVLSHKKYAPPVPPRTDRELIAPPHSDYIAIKHDQKFKIKQQFFNPNANYEIRDEYGAPLFKLSANPSNNYIDFVDEKRRSIAFQIRPIAKYKFGFFNEQVQCIGTIEVKSMIKNFFQPSAMDLCFKSSEGGEMNVDVKCDATTNEFIVLRKERMVAKIKRIYKLKNKYVISVTLNEYILPIFAIGVVIDRILKS